MNPSSATDLCASCIRHLAYVSLSVPYIVWQSWITPISPPSYSRTIFASKQPPLPPHTTNSSAKRNRAPGPADSLLRDLQASMLFGITSVFNKILMSQPYLDMLVYWFWVASRVYVFQSSPRTAHGQPGVRTSHLQPGKLGSPKLATSFHCFVYDTMMGRTSALQLATLCGLFQGQYLFQDFNYLQIILKSKSKFKSRKRMLNCALRHLRDQRMP